MPTGIQFIFEPYRRAPFVFERGVEYDFSPGFNRTIHQKNIQAIHKSAFSLATKRGHTKTNAILEISTASTEELGRSLSAFNLQVTLDCQGEPVTRTVEQWYQSSKVYERGDGRDEHGRFSSLFNLPGGRLIRPNSAHNPSERLQCLIEGAGFNMEGCTPGKQIERFIEQQTNTKDLANRNRDALHPWITSILKDKLQLSDDIVTKVIREIDGSKTTWGKGTLKKVLGKVVRGEFENDRDHKIAWLRATLTDDVIRKRGYDPDYLRDEDISALKRENIKATQREQSYITQSEQLRTYVGQTFRLLHAIWFPEEAKDETLDIWDPKNSVRLGQMANFLERANKSAGVGQTYRKINLWFKPDGEHQISSRRIQYWLMTGRISDTNSVFPADTWMTPMTLQDLKAVADLLPNLEGKEHSFSGADEKLIARANKLYHQLRNELHELHAELNTAETINDWIQDAFDDVLLQWKESRLNRSNVIELFQKKIPLSRIQEWLRTGHIAIWNGPLQDERLSLSWHDMRTIKGMNAINDSVEERFEKERNHILKQIKDVHTHQRLDRTPEYWIEHLWTELLDIWSRYSDSTIKLRLEQTCPKRFKDWDQGVDLNFMMKGELHTSTSSDPFRYDLLKQAGHIWKWIRQESSLKSCDYYHDASFNEEETEEHEKKENGVSDDRVLDKERKKAEERQRTLNSYYEDLLPWLQGSIHELGSKVRPLLERSRPFRAQSGLGRVKEYRLMRCDTVWTIEENVDEFCLFTWLYWKGLQQREGTLEEICKYDAFTDIYFNRHRRLMNCQARAAAMAVRICDAERKGDTQYQFDAVLQSQRAFKKFMREMYADASI